MSRYVNDTIHNVTIAANAHRLASEHYQKYARLIKLPQDLGVVIVSMVSFVGSVTGGDDGNQQYYFYATTAVSLLTALCVAIDRNYGWSKQAYAQSKLAFQYSQLVEKLEHVRRQQLLRSKSAERIVPLVGAIEENYRQLWTKNPRPGSVFTVQAEKMAKTTLELMDMADKRRLSESLSQTTSQNTSKTLTSQTSQGGVGGMSPVPKNNTSSGSTPPVTAPTSPRHSDKMETPRTAISTTLLTSVGVM
ncbi:MAG TPA: hypothetical protein V6C97_21535 [Oculatellaceae cyanobacterium]